MGFKSGVLRFNAVLLAVFTVGNICRHCHPAAAGRLLANEESIPKAAFPVRANLARVNLHRSERPRKDKWDDNDNTKAYRRH